MISKNWRIIVLMFFTVAFFPHLVFAEEPLTLESSIDIALKNSIVINIAKEGTKSATAQKKEAITGFLPKFSTSYSYTRLNEAPFSRFEGLPGPPSPFAAMNGMEITAWPMSRCSGSPTRTSARPAHGAIRTARRSRRSCTR